MSLTWGTLYEKLKSAGMLTDDEFEEKRKELVSRL